MSVEINAIEAVLDSDAVVAHIGADGLHGLAGREQNAEPPDPQKGEGMENAKCKMQNAKDPNPDPFPHRARERALQRSGADARNPKMGVA